MPDWRYLLKTEKTMLTRIEDILVILSEKRVITEDQFLVYVMHRLREEKRMRTMTPESNEKEKVFTVVWFDYEKNHSELYHTLAKSSIEAIEKAQPHTPPCTNVSAYQLKIPESIRFSPEDAAHQ
jgi:hypothetical protein